MYLQNFSFGYLWPPVHRSHYSSFPQSSAVGNLEFFCLDHVDCPYKLKDSSSPFLRFMLIQLFFLHTVYQSQSVCSTTSFEPTKMIVHVLHGGVLSVCHFYSIPFSVMVNEVFFTQVQVRNLRSWSFQLYTRWSFQMSLRTENRNLFRTILAYARISQNILSGSKWSCLDLKKKNADDWIGLTYWFP